jgi:hypothetical protein
MPDIELNEPFQLKVNGSILKEFPMSVTSFSNIRIGYSGGGYFRLLPYPVIHKIMKSQKYVMTYFHPRDFDAEQPVLPGLSPYKKFKAYYGLNNSFTKFEKLISDFNFVPLQQFDKIYEWKESKIISFP